MIDLVAFASDIADLLFDADGCDIDLDAIRGALEQHGIVAYRAPTENELADEEWWGHEYSIGDNDKAVGELTPEFKALRKARKDAIADQSNPVQA